MKHMVMMGYHFVCFKWVLISKPLSIKFWNCLKAGYFPTAWKKANIVPVRKKENKQILDNYRPVSLSPICSKLFEKIILIQFFNT